LFELWCNTQVGGLKLVQFYGDDPFTPNNNLGLEGYTLRVGNQGIINASQEQTKIVDGYLTSYTGTLKITNTVDTDNELYIDAVITDHESEEVGLTISSDAYYGKRRIVALGGSSSNTFTGETIVTGRNTLRLKKTNGATAIQGKLNILNGARVELHQSNQINKYAEVLLSSSGATASELVFVGHNKQQTLHKIIVEGTGKIDFGKDTIGNNALLLDDLVINNRSRLIIDNWIEGKHYLLVRKNSIHLNAALNKIEFTTGRKWGHLEDYDQDYYSISNAPEPAICGAGVMALGIGTLAWQRRKSRR